MVTQRSEQYFGWLVKVQGKVQGVGFRPFVWQLAHQLNIKGSVCNSGRGVEIYCWATSSQCQQLITLLRQNCPPLAQIQHIEKLAWRFNATPIDFTITASVQSDMHTQVVPDAATCPACLAELFDPTDRRWHYVFTNCTHCGPRFSIIKHMPYDRQHTSMAAFKMCPKCQAEYDAPNNRRFHAQPNACPECGPQVWLADKQGHVLQTKDAAIETTAKLLLEGKIIAIKGIGGFHLCCDATNNEAVQRLRERKHRPSKPLAVMLPNLDNLSAYTTISNKQLQILLRSVAAPIVLVPKTTTSPLSNLIAPGLGEVGLMLPSNPLQHLLLAVVKRALVATSGNASGFAPALDNKQALSQLNQIADYWLLHNRDIVQRVDDSVIRFNDIDDACDTTNSETIRRARGYVPDTLELLTKPEQPLSVLACGADLKNTFCMTKNGQAIVSQHFGDIDNPTIHRQHAQTRRLFEEVWNFKTDIIAIDAHPNYLSAHYGRSLAQELNIPCIPVYHHHAHVLAVLAEHGYTPEQGAVIALALDGLGYGPNGQLWGGECLKVDYQNFTWLGGLPPVALPGGDLAARQPWRNLLAQGLNFIPGWTHSALAKHIPTAAITVLSQAIKRGINSPLASSTGRLFDAVAAALGLCDEQISWEGEAACNLEAVAKTMTHKLPQHFAIPLEQNYLDLASFWNYWLSLPKDQALRAWVFHDSLAHGFAQLVHRHCATEKINTVVLCGGVLHNQLFRQRLLKALDNRYQVLLPQQFPAGDGAIALGQATYVNANAQHLLSQTSK